MAAYLDLGRKDGRRRRKDRDFDFQYVELVTLDGGEARILQSCADGAMNHGVEERFFSFDAADAASQASAMMKRHESACLPA